MHRLHMLGRSVSTAVLLTLCVCTVTTVARAQQRKFWVFLKDKQGDANKAYVSSKTLTNRSLLGLELLQYTDIPVTRGYVELLAQYAQLSCQSKWLNAVSVVGTEEEISKIKKFGFVDRIVPIKGSLIRTGNFPAQIDDYALEQIKGRAFQKSGLTGAGVSIGIIDGGFLGADVSPELEQFFKERRVKQVRDYVNPLRKDFYTGDEKKIGNHGTHVCNLMAGKTMGMAKASDYYLARTEDLANESALEEDYWITSLEWLDSLGVRLVNSSLGYSLDFDKQSEDHKPEEMNGKTCPISKAAQIGAEQKGMIIVVSAGNEGNNERWGTVTAPADAKGVISVGATDKVFLKRDNSSFGPPNLSYLKPDIACYSVGGTSFSAPVITAMVACMIQQKPSLTNTEVSDILKKASNLYPYGNNFIGYGVPDAEKVLALMDNARPSSTPARMDASGDLLDMKVGDLKAVAFHKENKERVLYQEVITNENGRLKVARFKGASRTTLLLSDRMVEIFWK